MQVREPGLVGPSSFSLQVLARDAAGEPESPGLVSWSASVVGAVVTPSGTNATVTVPSASTAGDWFTIEATAGPRKATALVRIVAAASGSNDEARDDEVPGEQASVALTAGKRGVDCTYDLISAFVSRANLGQLVDAASACARTDAAIFSVDGRPLIAPDFGWTNGGDVVTAQGNGGPMPVPLQLIIGVSNDAAAAEAAASAHLLTAGDMFTLARSGIAFDLPAADIIRQPLPSSERWCTDFISVQPSVPPHPNKLNIYYIDDIVDPLGSAPWFRGYYCAPNVILVSMKWAIGSTTAHELGHALGLTAQNYGHTDGLAGFASDNVMHSAATFGEDNRDGFSLGQLYRMHRDTRSWLNHASAPNPSSVALPCPCDPYGSSVCPLLSVDLRPMLGPASGPWGGTCN